LNIQFKKGVLEMLVLFSVAKKDMYGYELVQEVSKVTDINEGTIYPLLRRLTNEKCFETYLVESTEGPPRKYYRLTSLGIKRKNKILSQWNDFSKQVNKFIKGSDKNE
jgi:PadR family transcriptional regulator PadR